MVKLGTIESVVNYELKLVSKWLRLNKLSLNAGKTKLVFFGSKQHSLDYETISMKFKSLKFTPVEVKYLGIYIDKYLSWNFHVSKIIVKNSQKLSRANGILLKLKYFIGLYIIYLFY